MILNHMSGVARHEGTNLDAYSIFTGLQETSEKEGKSITPEEYGERVSSQFAEPMMTAEYFQELVDDPKWRSPHLWERKHHGWEQKWKVWE